jgi:molecular chaperone GrpE
MSMVEKDGNSQPATDTALMSGDPEATAVLVETPDKRRADDELEQALAVAEEKARESRDNHLRALAEIENVRRRAARDVENAHRYALEKFATELLAVRDTLEMGLEAGEKADVRSLLAGKEATLKLLTRAFEKFSIAEINPLGQPFDPQLHEAMAMQESATAEPNSVLQVVQKGYQLNGRLLRPARVIVAKAPGA